MNRRNKLAIAAIIACSSFAASGLASEAGQKPSHWRKVPVSHENVSSSATELVTKTTLYNTDKFDKICDSVATVEVWNGTSPNIKRLKSEVKAFIFSQDTRREHVSKFELSEEMTVVEGSYSFGLSCVEVPIPMDPEDLPDPSLVCSPIERNCDHVCAASENSFKQCALGGDKLTYSMDSINAEFQENKVAVSVNLENSNEEDLTCSYVLKVLFRKGSEKIISEAEIENIVVDVAETEVYKTYTIPNGAQYKGAKLYGTCSSKEEISSESLLVSCNPVKKPECNWVEVKN